MAAADESRTFINRIKRAEGQLAGVTRMISENKPCDEILNQLSAARAAIDKVALLIITKRMKECLKEGYTDEDAINKALGVFEKHAENIRHR